jgi:uncharacterized protein YjbI with pentapeptide repeats
VLLLPRLRGANLTGANLVAADLTGADLTGANLVAADLTGADLTGVRGLARQQLATVKSLKNTVLPDSITEG